ncbi:saccharopine dehydrogenase [Helicobacter pullorum MIT 98-5489]|uniref:Saccharopine dehydrogenase n=1 Tax=Helicobacter pullorum MIT 98-5489 TaxID=537972 RepID=C5F164_9HELI|nr:saccharopine dehydrogenase [Helicobacter pullorum MIT 98-5489]
MQNILVAKVGDEFAGFIGVSEKSIEMLFVSPKFSHIGFGRALMCEAIDAFFVRQNEIFVDCNEENKKGLSFYQKLGFMQRSRSKTDSKGRNFPIIHFSITKAKLLANLTNDVNTDIESNLALNPDLKKDEIYRKFEREEKHFALESNTQDLKNESYFGGQWRDVAPLALMKEWEYPEVGVKNSYLLYHEELESLIRNIKGLKRIRFFMTFGESYLTHMKCLENVGLLRVDEVEHNGQKIVPIQVLKTLLPDPASLAPRTKGQTHIGCYIKGVKDGKERTIYIYNICDHEACYKEVNAQGVSYTTGVPAMIGAKLICEGKWGVGASKNSSSGNHLQDFVNFEAVITDEVTPAPKSAKNSQSTTSNTRIYGGNGTESKILECQKDGEKNVSCIADSRTQQSLTQNIRIAESDNCHSERSEESKHIESNYAQERLALNADMPKGGEYQGIDSNNGSGVWNMEQNDPDPFMRELNKQGLPYVVLEIDSNGDSKVLEDGRK